MDSAEATADDKTPGPMTEINFWEAKCINLESLFEQVIKLNLNEIFSCPKHIFSMRAEIL